MYDYPKEQLRQLYKNLPVDLQEQLFSETAEKIIDKICEKNKFSDEKMLKFKKIISYVLLGLLPPEQFQKSLEKELKIKKDKAEEIALQIVNFVFLPVKKSLEILYNTRLKTKTKISKKQTRKKVKKDKYREPIE